MKDTKKITSKIQQSLTCKNEASEAVHTYTKAPVLKEVSQVPKALPKRKKDLRHTVAVPTDWNQEVSQTMACSLHLESERASEANLVPERVKQWKNPSAIVRKMQRSSSAAAKLPKKISVVSGSEEQKTRQNESNQDELWRDLMKNQEERQFRLDRITNFFT